MYASLAGKEAMQREWRRRRVLRPLHANAEEMAMLHTCRLLCFHKYASAHSFDDLLPDVDVPTRGHVQTGTLDKDHSFFT